MTQRMIDDRSYKYISGLKVVQTVIIFLVLLLKAPEAFCEELLKDIEIDGYVKSLNVSLQPSSLEGIPSGFVTSNQQRVDWTSEVNELEFEFSVENSFIHSEAPLSELRPYIHESVNHLVKLETTVFEDKHSENKLCIDRLSLKKNFDYGELTVGRQAIGYGRMSLYSPLDVVEPFSPDALDTDNRPGIDAIRAIHYFDLGGEVGGAAVFGDTYRDNTYLFNFSQNTNGIDILGIGGLLRERLMFGGGLATDIAGIGLKAEAVVYKGKDVNKAGGDLHSTFFIAGIEGWYRFKNGINFIVEYLYNGAGESDPTKYLEVENSAANREGLISFFGQHYLLVGPTYSFTPRIDLKVLSFWNLGDESVLIRPLLAISVTDDIDMNIFWALTTGNKPSSQLPFIPRSEFGSIGDYGGIYLKYYF